jgi:hypothetical protein
MKKILVFIAFLIMLFYPSCSDASKDVNMVEYETGVFHNKNWEEKVGTYQGDVIPDGETALVIATSIFDKINKSTSAQEFTPQLVFYDEEEAIWIVSFWEETDLTTLGADCNIAMQKKDGKVLRIWFGE